MPEPTAAAPSPQPPAIQMLAMTKTFPGGIVANDSVSLAVENGSIHAIIGENGAGKSTLMSLLYGRYLPDSGRIRMNGQDVEIDSPARAIALGLGMVTQHSTLIPALTILENIVLGAEPTSFGLLDRRKARQKVQELAQRLGLALDWNAAVETLSVAALQKAEIVKALYRGARILILDEPTATLAPQEADALFHLLHTLRDNGTTIVFITHKLREVMAHSSRVTVLRGGRSVAELPTAETQPEELLGLMLGRAETLSPASDSLSPQPPRSWHESGGQGKTVPILRLSDVTILNNRRATAVRDVSLDVYPGEVLGVAGVDGSGQRELAEAIIGLRPLAKGQIFLEGTDIATLPIHERMLRGLAFIPEDRHREGLVLDFSLSENLILGHHREKRFGGGKVLDLVRISRNGETAVRENRVRAPGAQAFARGLSGGNQQKVVIARALEGSPRVLVAMTPTRGLDVDATRFVYDRFQAAQAKGLAILLFSLDLDEIFEISDRIAVMYNGGLADILPRLEATPDRIGQRMVGATL